MYILLVRFVGVKHTNVHKIKNWGMVCFFVFFFHFNQKTEMPLNASHHLWAGL